MEPRVMTERDDSVTCREGRRDDDRCAAPIPGLRALAVGATLLSLMLVGRSALRPAQAPEELGAVLVRIDLDTAEARQLQLLPGIGPRRAELIVEDRDAFGPFNGAMDLVRVHGIGPVTAGRAAPLIRSGEER